MQENGHLPKSIDKHRYFHFLPILTRLVIHNIRVQENTNLSRGTNQKCLFG